MKRQESEMMVLCRLRVCNSEYYYD